MGKWVALAVLCSAAFAAPASASHSQLSFFDASNEKSWLKSFLHYSHGRGTVWGLHNYEDVNHHRPSSLEKIAQLVDYWHAKVSANREQDTQLAA